MAEKRNRALKSRRSREAARRAAGTTGKKRTGSRQQTAVPQATRAPQRAPASKRSHTKHTRQNSLQNTRKRLRALRARQVAEQEAEARRRGRIPLWGRVLIGAGVVLLLMLVLFRVRKVEVYGSSRYTASEIMEAGGITEGDVLLGLSKTQTASRILTKLPYVTEVTVEKHLPGTVAVNLSECTALAAVRAESGVLWLVNSEGKLLESLEHDADNALPVLSGVLLVVPKAGDTAEFDAPARGALAMEAARLTEAAGMLDTITAIDVTDPAQMKLQYDGRIEVWMGDGSDLSYRFGYLKAALEKLPAASQGALDLGFSTGEQAIFHPVTGR